MPPPQFDPNALEEPITRILTTPGTDLMTISAKRVRKTLLQDAQYAYLGLTTDMLKVHRDAVDEVVKQVFTRVNEAAEEANGKADQKRRHEDDAGSDGGAGGEAETDDAEQDSTSTGPPKKKKGKNSFEENDAALARKLSTEINSRSRRGASSGGPATPRKTGKRKPKKSVETVDSEVEDEDGNESKSKKRRAAKGGFAKEYTLSVPLSAVLAVEKLSRPQVVKKLWEYIREHELQNPSNKKEIMCDDALRAVFSVDKIDMFRMNKVLGQHLHEG